MSYWEAVLLGVIQGLTEFLPISSTAHLSVVPQLLHCPDPGAAFTAVIQWGTLVAVLLYFHADITRLTRAFFAGLAAGKPWGTADGKLAWLILVGTVPIVLVGLLFKKAIETTLRSLTVIGWTAIVLALFLMAAELVTWRREKSHGPRKHIANLGWLDALLIGLAQAVALIPGASRSGVTITGALFLGMTRESAARFSFLLSLPAIFGAGVLELYHHRQVLLASQQDVLNLATATVLAGVAGYASIAFLLHFLKTHTTYVFVVYRLIAGSLILWALSRGILQDQPPV